MHRLLKRQLKKSSIDFGATVSDRAFSQFISFVDQTYRDADDDRQLLENSLEVSSNEMQELYAQLQKSTKNKMLKSEAKYSRLIENLKHHYFLYAHDTQGVFNYLSDSVTEMLGYSKEEFMQYYGTYHTDDPINDLVEEKTNKAIAGESQEPYMVSLYHKDGSTRILEVMEQPVFNNAGEVIEVEGIARDITKIIETQKELDHLAKHDSLTKISNRMYLYSQLEYIIVAAKRQKEKFALLFLDLDHFKNINDTLGHEVGDKLLQAFVKRVQPTIRKEDLFARIGGDEFVIVLRKIDEEHLGIVLNKLMSHLRKEFKIEEYNLKVTASIGVALYPDDGEDITTLMKSADIAMYKAKELGRNNFNFFTEELNLDVQRRVRLEHEMSKALKDNTFVLHYQPKLETKTNRLVGAEALIRWQHCEDGLIFPDQFIELAESTGFIVKLGRWIIEEGCRTIAELNQLGHNDLHLSLNISTRQIQNDDIYGVIKAAIELNKIAPSQLSLEITESVMLTKTESSVAILTKLKSLGVNICLDDFGTGYSALSYLHQYPIDAVKIDRSFVELIPKDGSKAVLLDTIIAMGETLDLHIIAEGVEEEYQRDYLMKRECEYYQGFLFSKAVDKECYIKLAESMDS